MTTSSSDNTSYNTTLAGVLISTVADGLAMSTERLKTVSSYLPILILQIVMGCTAIAVNSLVLSVFIIGKVNNSLAYLICNLAVANIMLGVALSARATIEILDVNVGYSVQFICHVALMVAIMNMGTCITTIFCLCFNMYLSIGHSVKFRDGLSRKKTGMFLGFWWMFWFGYALAIFSAATNSAASQESFSCNFANDHYNRKYVVTFVGISICISLLTIVFIYKTIQSIRAQIVAIRPSVTEQRNAMNIAAGQRLHYMAKTVALILGLYVTCWGPFMITHFVASICPKQCSIPDNVIISVSTLPIVHSLANIMIYTYRSREFRNILFDRIFFSDRSSRCPTDIPPTKTPQIQPRAPISLAYVDI